MIDKLIGTVCLALLVKANIEYHLSMDEENWFQAGINCRGAGMELASLVNSEENEALYNLMTHFNSTTGYWLSGTNLGNGIWYWYSTGSPIIYTNWLPGQPDNGGSPANQSVESCLQWGIYGQDPLAKLNGWNDLGCTRRLPYVCQLSKN